MNRQHIYLCNGSPELHDLLRQLFTDERYNVTGSNFVPKNDEQIEALGPSFVIVEVTLGEFAGWHLIDRLAQGSATKGIPIDCISALPSLLDRARALPVDGVQHAFIEKPFDLQLVVDTVD